MLYEVITRRPKLAEAKAVIEAYLNAVGWSGRTSVPAGYWRSRTHRRRMRDARRSGGRAMIAVRGWGSLLVAAILASYNFV